MIEREMLIDMFVSMRNNGIDTNKDLLWGYFFADRDPSKLEGVVPALEESMQTGTSSVCQLDEDSTTGSAGCRMRTPVHT